jgi:hypothetical protein
LLGGPFSRDEFAGPIFLGVGFFLLTEDPKGFAAGVNFYAYAK